MAESFPSFWKAEHDFVGDDAGAQLSFKKGETFLMIERHESGWFTAERNLERGYVPGNYFTKIEPSSKGNKPVSKRGPNANPKGNPAHASTSVLEIPERAKSDKDESIIRSSSSNDFKETQNEAKQRKPRPPIPISAPTQFKPNEAAAPPIPLRTDLGEQEAVPEEPEIPVVDDAINLSLLLAGTLNGYAKLFI
ncbi:MAG: SH3 domain-containing protein [Cytophagales bacterium]|nr:SH3 domain-containing protein [Cytophagales bacterium]